MLRGGFCWSQSSQLCGTRPLLPCVPMLHPSPQAVASSVTVWALPSSMLRCQSIGARPDEKNPKNPLGHVLSCLHSTRTEGPGSTLALGLIRILALPQEDPSSLSHRWSAPPAPPPQTTNDRRGQDSPHRASIHSVEMMSKSVH